MSIEISQTKMQREKGIIKKKRNIICKSCGTITIVRLHIMRTPKGEEKEE